jgi:hypothetical protein
MATESGAPSTLYIVSRGQIEHYDLSIGLRLIWLNNSLAFMFGVYAGLTIMQSPTSFMHAQAQLLNNVIPVIGFAVSLFTLSDVIAGVIQMNKLTKNYCAIHTQPEDSFPLLSGTLVDRFFQRFSPIASSLLFLAVWSYLIMYDHQWLN